MGTAPTTSIRPAQNSYAPGSTVRVTIENVGTRDLGYGHCPVSLQRRVGRRWEDVPGGIADPHACDLVLERLAPGQRRLLGDVRLASGIRPGAYRLVFDVVLVDPETKLPLRDRATTVFTVE